MKCVVEFKSEYKDDIMRFVSNGTVVSKDPGFNISNELSIFVNTNKMLKNQYKYYISLDSKKIPNGAICLNKDGDVLLLATTKPECQDALVKLLKKCDELLDSEKYDVISAKVDVDHILTFNEFGFKSIRFLEGETSEYKFLVQKRGTSEK